MAEEDKFDEIKNTIKIYRKEIDEKAKKTLETIDELSKITDTTKLIMTYSTATEKISDFIDMTWKLVKAQDEYIKELEKILDRMR